MIQQSSNHPAGEAVLPAATPRPDSRPLHAWQTRLPAALCRLGDAGIAFFGGWTVAYHVGLFAGDTFRQASRICWIVGLAAAALMLAWRPPQEEKPQPCKSTTLLFLLAAMLFAAALPLCLNHPDADDRLYVGTAIFSLDTPRLPMLAYKPRLGGRLVGSYEPLRASVSYHTHMPLLVSYYLLWPALIAVLMVVFHWRLLHLLRVGWPVLACCCLFVVWLCWGDVHRTPSNFGFVRLFQGKGALISLAIPAALFYWLQFATAGFGRAWRSFTLLFLTVAAGTGFTPTGVPVMLLMLGLFVASGALVSLRPFSLPWRSLLAVCCLAAYPLALGLAMKFFFGVVNHGVHTSDGVVQTTSTLAMMEYVLGLGFRGWVAVLAIATLPLTLPKSPCKPVLSCYAGTIAVLLLCPWTSNVLGYGSWATMSWRWLYVAPFALAVAMLFIRLAGLPKRPYQSAGVLAVLLSGYAASSPVCVVSPANRTTIKPLAYSLTRPGVIRLVTHGGQRAIIRGRYIRSPQTGKWW